MGIKFNGGKNISIDLAGLHRVRAIKRWALPNINFTKANSIFPIPLFLILFFIASIAATQGIITTVAGTGIAGFSGDSGPASHLPGKKVFR